MSEQGGPLVVEDAGEGVSSEDFGDLQVEVFDGPKLGLVVRGSANDRGEGLAFGGSFQDVHTGGGVEHVPGGHGLLVLALLGEHLGDGPVPIRGRQGVPAVPPLEQRQTGLALHSLRRLGFVEVSVADAHFVEASGPSVIGSRLSPTVIELGSLARPERLSDEAFGRVVGSNVEVGSCRGGWRVGNVGGVLGLVGARAGRWPGPSGEILEHLACRAMELHIVCRPPNPKVLTAR
jgi:hypothetical protein